MGLFEKLKSGLKKTKDAMMGRIEKLLNSFTKIDDELFDELEETLIMCDIGVETSVEICDILRERVKERGVTDPKMIMDMLKEIISEMMGEEQTLDLSTTPSVILVIGVNGVGKTTTIGKLAYQLHKQGKRVIVAAADTFRAAAIDQLEVWTERAGVELVKHNEGSDPAAVVFDALAAAKARKADVVICDTAGRLHNKKNLMNELSKISRIVHQQAEGCALEVLLALDATTGQNAVNQAKQFNEAADITGIILTKLDGTAKGGIVISISHDLKIPVKLVGVGEKLDDLQPFSTKDFVDALFMNDNDFEGNYERLKDDDEEDENSLEGAAQTDETGHEDVVADKQTAQANTQDQEIQKTDAEAEQEDVSIAEELEQPVKEAEESEEETSEKYADEELTHSESDEMEEKDEQAEITGQSEETAEEPAKKKSRFGFHFPFGKKRKGE